MISLYFMADFKLLFLVQVVDMEEYGCKLY